GYFQISFVASRSAASTEGAGPKADALAPIRARILIPVRRSMSWGRTKGTVSGKRSAIAVSLGADISGSREMAAAVLVHPRGCDREFLTPLFAVQNRQTGLGRGFARGGADRRHLN